MKILKNILGLLILTLSTNFSFAQPNENCFIDDCQTNILNVSTGVDQNNGSLYPATDPATAQDGFWSLINAPANQTVNFGPAWVIDPNGAWTTSPTANWISAFNVDDLNDDNPPPANPYTFQRCFCVCEDTELTFEFMVYADDQVANVMLDGSLLIPTPPYTSPTTDHFTDGIVVSTTIPVAQGEHCLTIDVRNTNGQAMGLMVDGNIIGANLLTSSCCDNTGNICGFKFNDVNQNGIWDLNEPPLANWTIELTGPNGTQSMQTDQNGNYCFNGLDPGTYTIVEVNQNGWTQTFPASPGSHTVNLQPNQVASNINFGNAEDEGGGCEIDSCNTNVLNISTGVDHNNGNLYPATDPATAQDAFWQLTNAPANQTVNFGPAWVIDPNGAWTTSPTSNWISAFNVDDLNDDNPAPANPYTFQRCFCVCEETDLTFDFMVYADDQIANVMLDGNLLIPTPPYTSPTTDHFTDGVHVDTTITVGAGQHCLSIDVRNTNGQAMGLMVDGDILGANLLTSVCCDNSGSICGFKWNDVDQDGIWDNNENPIQNWTIQVTGQNGTFSQQTDQNGNYCINNLAPGTYTVSEINQPGWIQSFPTSPGTHTVNLGSNQVASGINFGNYQEGGEPCELKALYKVVTIEGCYVELLDASFLASGDIVCTTWDFGDGTVITGGSPVGHFYDAPGVYNVCITVLAIVNGECCEDTYCEKIVVEGCKPEPCSIKVDFDINNSNCLYQFDGTIISANTNIDVWFWDFGDGTTGNGQQVTHSYAPGSYVVCLTAIVKPTDRDDCCTYRICKDIFVDCTDGFGSDNSDHREGQEDTIDKTTPTKSALQVFPNPASSLLYLKTKLEGRYEISIYDATGKQFYNADANEQFIEIDLQSLDISSGIYIIELDNGTEQLREKFVFQK